MQPGGSALVAQPDSAVGQLPVPASVPLGADGASHPHATLAVPYGSTLVLYTDGLAETRRADAGTQAGSLERELGSVVCISSSRLGHAANHILGLLLADSGARGSDVTLLLARMPAAPVATAST